VYKEGQQDSNLDGLVGYRYLEWGFELLEFSLHQSCIAEGYGILSHTGMVFETCMQSSGVHFEHNESKPLIPSLS